jgi:ABC-type sugar transport system permease subunit
MSGLLILPIIILVIVCNYYWYYMKNILSDNDIKVSYWHSHFKNLSNFNGLIKNTKDPLLKASYNRIYYRVIVSMFLFILFGLILFLSETNR